MKPGLMVAGATIPMTSFSTHSATWITSIDSPVIVIHYRYSRQQYQQTNPSQLNPSPLLKEMPPARRRGGNTTANQPTLSFGSQARVTKPSATPTVPQKAKELEPATSAIPEKPSNDVAEPEQAPVTPAEPSKPHVAELAVRGQAKVETQQPWGEEDKKALEVSETDLQQYWKEEEGKRKAPRVHQGDITLHEKILRHFDLCSQYGPCIGIARTKRWRRANMLGLNPPIEVLAVLLKDQEDVKQRAYVDELMS